MRNILIFVMNSVLYFVLMVFLLGGGECYLGTVVFDSFSGCTCILILLDEQRHLVGHFFANIRPFLPHIKRGVHLLICWCLVSVWPLVGQYVFLHW